MNGIREHPRGWVMDGYPEKPEDVLTRMTPADLEKAFKIMAKWLHYYLSEPGASLESAPFAAFLTGYVLAAQWRDE
jgi:hypothetical protein